ncbi:MAG: type II toxin-antitoxin system CcdA family antitoxin [archaeon]
MTKKSNLTLRINEEVLNKARKLGLNLSSLTEDILKAESHIKDSDLITPSKLREAYRKVFLKILKITKEWSVYVKIGGYLEEIKFKDSKGKMSSYPMHLNIYLSPEGKIELCGEEETLTQWNLQEEWPVNNLTEPEQIIKNLIDIIYTVAEQNRDKIRKIELLEGVLNKLETKKEETDTP